jgi:hypothetical protein
VGQSINETITSSRRVNQRKNYEKEAKIHVKSPNAMQKSKNHQGE